LRAALNWSLAEPGTGGLRCCAALQRFWWTRGHIAEGREWCRRALNHAGAEARTAERAKVLNAAGLLANYQADYAAAWAQHQESLAIRRELGDRHGIASSLNNLGNVTLDQGDLSAARALYEESLAIMREVGQGSGIAPVLNNVAGIAYEQGDYPKARALHEESLAICRGLGDRIGVARSLNNLGRVAHARRDYAAAAKLYAEALGILRALDDHRGMAISLEGLAAVRTARGEHAAAARIWSSAERLREEIGSPLASSARLRYREDIDAARAALADDAAFDSAWREGSAQTLDRAIDFALQTSERA